MVVSFFRLSDCGTFCWIQTRTNSSWTHTCCLWWWGVSELASLVSLAGCSLVVSRALPGAICCPPPNPGACLWWLASYSVTPPRYPPPALYIFPLYYVDTNAKARHGALPRLKTPYLIFLMAKHSPYFLSPSLPPHSARRLRPIMLGVGLKSRVHALSFPLSHFSLFSMH